MLRVPLQIVLCEIYSEVIHGSCEDARGHFLVHSRYNPYSQQMIQEEEEEEEEYQESEEEFDDTHIDVQIRRLGRFYKLLSKRSHGIVGKRTRISVRPQLAHCFELPENKTMVCIIKTFWICWIQRAWRRVLKERSLVYAERSRSLSHRLWQQSGKWPSGIRNVPGLKGMLAI